MAGTSNSMKVEQVYQDYLERYNALCKAFTMGRKEPPASDDPELPQPAMGMTDEEWMPLAAERNELVKVSSAWLQKLALHQASAIGLLANEKEELFQKINKLPTLYEKPSPEKTPKLSTSIKEGINSEGFVADFDLNIPQAENKGKAILEHGSGSLQLVEHGSGGSSQKRLRGEWDCLECEAPNLITKEKESPSPNTPSSHVFLFNNGDDIVESLATFAKHRNMVVSVLRGSGVVSNVKLRQPAAGPTVALKLHGILNILTLSGTFLPDHSPPCRAHGLTVCFQVPQDGEQGLRVIGGEVLGPLTAFGTVVVIAATFTNPTYHQQPLGQDEGGSGASGGGGRTGRGGDRAEAAAGGCIYSLNLRSMPK